jgi:membrane protease YdiL (CAAX protease family)
MTAFVFSAIHLQFYGFIPRLILGLAFGYLFLWTKNIWLPVIAHFVNNAVPTIGAWLSGAGNYSNNVDVPLWKQLLGLPVPIIVCTFILLYFRNKSKTEQNIIISGQ